MLSLSLLLVIISAVRHYTLNLIIPGVTILMLLGAILPLVPGIGFKAEEFYKFIGGIPEIVLFVIIPILIFDSGRKLRIDQIKKEVIPIGFFAIVGVIITIVIIGVGASLAFQIPLIDALLFGTILAATDPAAVGAIFKKFPIPHKLNLIIEGELTSLRNCLLYIHWPNSYIARYIERPIHISNLIDIVADTMS